MSFSDCKIKLLPESPEISIEIAFDFIEFTERTRSNKERYWNGERIIEK